MISKEIVGYESHPSNTPRTITSDGFGDDFEPQILFHIKVLSTILIGN